MNHLIRFAIILACSLVLAYAVFNYAKHEYIASQKTCNAVYGKECVTVADLVHQANSWRGR